MVWWEGMSYFWLNAAALFLLITGQEEAVCAAAGLGLRPDRLWAGTVRTGPRARMNLWSLHKYRINHYHLGPFARGLTQGWEAVIDTRVRIKDSTVIGSLTEKWFLNFPQRGAILGNLKSTAASCHPSVCLRWHPETLVTGTTWTWRGMMTTIIPLWESFMLKSSFQPWLSNRSLWGASFQCSLPTPPPGWIHHLRNQPRSFTEHSVCNPRSTC